MLFHHFLLVPAVFSLVSGFSFEKRQDASGTSITNADFPAACDSDCAILENASLACYANATSSACFDLLCNATAYSSVVACLDCGVGNGVMDLAAAQSALSAIDEVCELEAGLTSTTSLTITTATTTFTPASGVSDPLTPDLTFTPTSSASASSTSALTAASEVSTTSISTSAQGSFVTFSLPSSSAAASSLTASSSSSSSSSSAAFASASAPNAAGLLQAGVLLAGLVGFVGMMVV
ncbi:hypothetical protein P7C73_g6173, partial [Tremellales sp. Uapishka_1]